MAKLLDRYRKVESQVDAALLGLVAKAYTAPIVVIVLLFIGWALWH